jgi:hypothetical protein
MTTLYRKEGRKYVPCAEYSPEVMDSMPEGSHLVVVQPGIKSIRYSVQPAFAPVMAVIALHRDLLAKAASEATRPRPMRKLTPREHRAWQAYQAATGNDSLTLTTGCAMGIVDALERAILEAK